MNLTVREIAEDLNVCPRTILRRIKSGDLPAYRVGHQSYRVADKDYEQYKERIRTVRAETEE